MALPEPFLDPQVAPHVPHVPPSRPQMTSATTSKSSKTIGFTIYLLVGGVKGGVEDGEGRPNHQIPAGSVKCHFGEPQCHFRCTNVDFSLVL